MSPNCPNDDPCLSQPSLCSLQLSQNPLVIPMALVSLSRLIPPCPRTILTFPCLSVPKPSLHPLTLSLAPNGPCVPLPTSLALSSP